MISGTLLEMMALLPVNIRSLGVYLSQKHRLSVVAQKRVIGIEVSVASALVGASFVVVNVPFEFRAFGVVAYIGLALATVCSDAPADCFSAGGGGDRP